MGNVARWVFNLLFTLIPVILLVVFFVSLSTFFRDLNEYRAKQAQAELARLEAVQLRAVGNVNTQTLEQARRILTQRLQHIGVRGFRIEVQNSTITVRLPKLEAAERNRVNALLTQRGNLALQLVKTSANNRSVAQIRPTDLEAPALTNRDLERVQAGQGESGRPALTLRLNREGAARFARLTSANVGRRVAIVVDGRILIAPTIRGPITGGAVSIQGFTAQETERLSDLLQTAPLPVRLEVVKP
ncbi:MAG: hypothetical protein KatS3mg074_012 [Meiothermus sp.]|uniref:SecDF P1 head subdomain domain-containing protein n=2 Tax=Meiothermus hypogaeus TaxID=884155 RepID=A0A511QWT5_9DEIN|nr:hypothetical protein [Meiothermus hypogaeus]RIH79189.1 protein-export membrane protein SecD [Meiothermus hypogaeus]GEM81835.1 hypothetical protein MHY01S_00010 [Meiothermus hypogaeus NBRC 106114]GIW37614.1 MAG: hypothetical protein KatS3mg074_012 [Meiothermus sp.]